MGNALPGARATAGISKEMHKLAKFEHVAELVPVKKKPDSLVFGIPLALDRSVAKGCILNNIHPK